MVIGNDVVWLADPQNFGRHADVLLVRRILTARERLLVQISHDPDRMLWSLWAAKEAAYKAWSRSSPGAKFSPASFEVVPEPRSKAATVHHEGWSVPVKWDQGPDWVHAVAADGPTVSRVGARSPGAADSGGESAAVRALALRLAAEAGWGPGTIEGRPPEFRGEGSPRLVSLSHDGPYLAACLG
jgi:phosphopantetheine--protein transferase-like protein